jgi:unsaturated rhamnogalacturonyl hydrolase
VSQQINDPLEIARRLANVYGYKLDVPVVYTQGVALSGRLRFYELEPDRERPTRELEKIVAPRLAEGIAMFGNSAGTANYAGICWADELYSSTGDGKYRELLTQIANLFEEPSADHPIAPPLDTDIRVEDLFFASAVLGRAFDQSGDEKYIRKLVNFLLASAETLQPDGLWWHCKASPFYWGRGNAFAALGFAEALTFIPSEYPGRDALVEIHLRHLAGLRKHQDSSGLWRQVVDRPDSYLEHSATSMIGYALARGIRKGWLNASWNNVVDATWAGASERIGPNCELEHVCAGTGPQPDLNAYLERPFSDGLDDRGGSMILWFAVEMARLERGV